MDLTSPSTAFAAPLSDEQFLMSLEEELAKVKATMSFWSDKVEAAAIGSPEKAEAEEREGFYLQRVRDLEQQVIGKSV
jgi:hypothetical protein